MSITLSIYALCVIVILALMGGFWIGRSVKWMMIDTESRIPEDEEQDAEPEQGISNRATDMEEKQNRRMRNGARRIPLGWAIGSPVGGTVRSVSDGTKRGALIQPEQGILYAPVSGKIIRLFPKGNRLLLRADFGVELLLCVGEIGDEMHSVYYRSHVVPNEIITKGKVLLEFDIEKMQEEGVDTAVAVMVEAAEDYRDITVTRKEQVKAGEEILWIREPGLLESE